MRGIVEQLTIPSHNVDIDLADLNPPQLQAQVTGHSYTYIIQVDCHELHINGFITPGEWYIDEDGKRNRRYGGEYEVMNLRIEIPAEIQGDNILRNYGTYNRQIVDGQFQWVRIDEYHDFLEIDQVHIQVIRPMCD